MGSRGRGAEAAGGGFAPAELIESLLRGGVAVRIEVAGRSMRPLLSGSETATVAPADAVSLSPGELVLCRGAAGALVLHRLVAVSGAGAGRRWHTRGDALMAPDEPFAAAQVLGRVTRIEGLRLPLAPAALGTDGRAWRAASGCAVAAAAAGRLARRVAARVGRATKCLTIRSDSRKVRRPL